jgi:hypothetical protein
MCASVHSSTLEFVSFLTLLMGFFSFDLYRAFASSWEYKKIESYFFLTPMNTKINDLKNQLKFIGIEHVDSMFEILQNKYDYDIDALMYLLRPLIIRHSQNQMYKGTKTTLMSLPPKVRVTIDLFYGCLVYA